MTWGPKFSLKVIDRGLEQLRSTLQQLAQDRSYVKAGVVGKAATEPRDTDGLSNAELATIHEFGLGTVPARPFIMPSFLANKAKYKAGLQKLAQDVFRGKRTWIQSLGLLGMKMASDMKAYVTQGESIPPPLSPATLARKLAKGHGSGSPRALVDTGRLVGSITWEVVQKTSGDD